MKLSEDSFVKRMYNKMFSGVPVAKLRASGYILLTTCSQGRDLISSLFIDSKQYISQGMDVVEFFEEFGMPDTFYSWFLVTELHVWLVGVGLEIVGIMFKFGVFSRG